LFDKSKKADFLLRILRKGSLPTEDSESKRFVSMDFLRVQKLRIPGIVSTVGIKCGGRVHATTAQINEGTYSLIAS
jgi:hypothetical protein